MPYIDQLTQMTAGQLLDTDIVYVGREGDPDPDRNMQVGQFKSALLTTSGVETFVPIITGSTTNPTVTYTTQDAISYRQGAFVFVAVSLGWSALSGGSGDLRITGFLVPSNGAIPQGTTSMALRSMNGVAFGSGRTFATISLAGSAAWANVTTKGDGVSTQFVTIGDLSSSGFISFSGMYLA